MAWDDSIYRGEQVMVGDKPMDEIALTRQQLAIVYLERYDRKPTVAEILHAFSLVAASNAGDYFSDPASVARISISLKEKGDRER